MSPSALIRRTPLRSRTPLRRRSPLRRRTGLRRTSAKGRKRRRQWERVRAVYLAANPWCERCLRVDGRKREASQVHHIVGGNGGRVHEWWNLIALCCDCHNGNAGPAHGHPRESKLLFVRIKRAKGEWNACRAAQLACAA